MTTDEHHPPYRVCGALFMRMKGPSFGTPIYLTYADELLYIQDSVNMDIVNNFVTIDKKRMLETDFISLETNYTSSIGDKITVAFRDIHDDINLDIEENLIDAINSEIDLYAQYPFLTQSLPLGTEKPSKIKTRYEWTDADIELLGKLWGEGLSAQQIASLINKNLTRNSVIGKIHRLGLSSPKTNVYKEPQYYRLEHKVSLKTTPGLVRGFQTSKRVK